MISIKINLCNWETRSPMGCEVWNGNKLVDSDFCGTIGEFVDFIRQFEIDETTNVSYIFDGRDLFDPDSKVREFAAELNSQINALRKGEK